MSETTTKITQEEAEKASAIMLAINLDSAFKLYSFRILTHQQFVSQAKELVQLFIENTKND